MGNHCENLELLDKIANACEKLKYEKGQETITTIVECSVELEEKD